MAEVPQHESRTPDEREVGESREQRERREFELEFYQRTTPVLPELYWVGRAIQEGRIGELAGQPEALTISEQEGREIIHGTADRQEVLTEVVERFGRIARQDGREPGKFLEYLTGIPKGPGLPERREHEDPGVVPDFEALARVEKYLALVEEELELVDLRIDKVEVVNHSARSLHHAQGNVDVLRTAMNYQEPTYNGDGLTTWEYLGLGSVNTAHRAVDAVLRGVKMVQLQNPFFTNSRVHMRHARLEMLRGERRDELLGPNVAKRMQLHVQECTTCHKAFEDARNRDGREFAGPIPD